MMNRDDLDPDSPCDPETTKLSRKDLAKKMRHEAYQRAKEFKKNDPGEIARKALAKEQRKAFYQKAKERHKAATQTKKEKPDLKNKIMFAKDLVTDDRPLAPVIPIDFHKLKQK